MATKAQTKIAYHQLGQTLRSLEADLRWGLAGSVRIPQAWHDIAQGAVVPQKEKITLRLDADVVSFFRSMGAGHLTRMNAVLRAFMLARLAEVVQAVPDYDLTPADEEAQIKAELFAIVNARAVAREAAEAAIVQAPKVDERMAVLHEAFNRYRTGK